MKKFQEICGGPDEASVMLRYLSGCGTAQYLSVLKNEFVEVRKLSKVILMIRKIQLFSILSFRQVFFFKYITFR
jgi:hypothetical protein